MSATLQALLSEVARIRGVRAAVLASERDGLAAASVAAVGIDIDALAAFGMAIFRRARLANEAAGYGATHFVVLDAERGRLFVAAAPELSVVVLAEREAGAGLIRVAMQRAARAIT